MGPSKLRDIGIFCGDHVREWQMMDGNYLGVIFAAAENALWGMNAALALLEQKINSISCIGPIMKVFEPLIIGYDFLLYDCF